MRKIPGWLPILLGFLQAVGPVSTDMYLPAFPAIEASFHTGPGTAQVTLGTWFLGLAVGQLVQGTLADRFGRRRPLLLGTLLYTFGAVGCAMSGSMGAMAAWRFVAAVGGSASMVIPRAIVRDISEGHEQARLMSRLILVLGVAPILAPTLGGLLLDALPGTTPTLLDTSPAVRGDRLVGWVSRSSLATHLQAEGDSYLQGSMSRSLQTASPSEKLGAALRRAAALGANEFVPVVEDGAMVGLLTPASLERAVGQHRLTQTPPERERNEA